MFSMSMIASLLFVIIVVIVGTKIDDSKITTPIETDKPHTEEQNNEEVLGATLQPEPTILPETSVPVVIEENKNYEVTDNSYIYPGSAVVETSSGSIKMTSTGNADEVTKWYKDKIVSMGMNVNSFVSTKTNGNILNKLSGADGTREVKVEIKKKANDTTVEIMFVETIN